MAGMALGSEDRASAFSIANPSRIEAFGKFKDGEWSSRTSQR